MANIDRSITGARIMAADAIDDVDSPPRPDPPAEDVDQSARAKFWRWVLDDTSPTTVSSSLLSTLDHVQSFWDDRHADSTVLLHYADLRADLEGQILSLADRLGIDVPTQYWPRLVKAASFDEMRDKPSMTAPEAGLFRDDAAFFKTARQGEWLEILDNEQDLRRYNDRAAVLAPAQLLAWLHRS
jgi:hypothetical protein